MRSILLQGDTARRVSAAAAERAKVPPMIEMPDDDVRRAAARAAAEALADDVVPDAVVLEAVQHGLLSVPAGSPTSWFDVPSQRGRLQTGTLATRRPH